MDLFSDETRRNPWPVYQQLRDAAPVLRVPPPFDAWVISRYDDVKRALTDHETFSSRVPAPQWFIFFDPPVHTKLRSLISRAFTPRVVAGLEPRVRQLSRELLAKTEGRAAEYSVPLAMQVISGMIGIPAEDWPRFRHWSDTILTISYSRSGGEEAERSLRDFRAATAEMNDYLGVMIEARHKRPEDDLLTALVAAEVDGERLSQEDILSFFQLLIVAGQETTANLIANAMLCLMEHPEQLARLRATPELLSSAIEEVLRYRSPLQWLMRMPRRDVELHGQTIPAGKLLLCIVGAANRDERQFPDAGTFDIGRGPNPHIAFGHGIHFCLGAALSRLETKIALSDLLARFSHFEPADDRHWPPRRALNVHGPASLPIRARIMV